MAIAFTLVESTGERMRYLCANTSPFGTTATLPNDGGATPDLTTDLATSPAGPLTAIVKVRQFGLGQIAAGAITQAQARALFLSDDSGANIGNDKVFRAVTTISPRTGTAPWAVDADVDGQGDPVLVVTTTAAAGEAYLDIYFRHSYADR